jgi:hypothetical protein
VRARMEDIVFSRGFPRLCRDWFANQCPRTPRTHGGEMAARGRTALAHQPASHSLMARGVAGEVRAAQLKSK